MNNVEVWKDIKGYEGLYQVSNLGRIKSIRRNIIMKVRKDKYGYYQLGLTKNKEQKTFKAHRLVAETFIPNHNNLPEINHKDEDKTNNRVENLEWCTSQENHIHAYKVLHRKGPNTGRTGAKNWCSKPVAQLKDGIVIAVFCSATEAGKKTGSSGTKIGLVCNGKRKITNGFEWKWN